VTHSDASPALCRSGIVQGVCRFGERARSLNPIVVLVASGADFPLGGPRAQRLARGSARGSSEVAREPPPRLELLHLGCWLRIAGVANCGWSIAIW